MRSIPSRRFPADVPGDCPQRVLSRNTPMLTRASKGRRVDRHREVTHRGELTGRRRWRCRARARITGLRQSRDAETIRRPHVRTARDASSVVPRAAHLLQVVAGRETGPRREAPPHASTRTPRLAAPELSIGSAASSPTTVVEASTRVQGQTSAPLVRGGDLEHTRTVVARVGQDILWRRCYSRARGEKQPLYEGFQSRALGKE